MQKFKIPVTWEECGFVEIESDSLENAVDYFNENIDDIALPTDGEYVDGSFCMTPHNNIEEIEVYQTH